MIDKKALSDIKGVLFDLDGVIHVGDTPISGAAETLSYLEGKNIQYRFVTNNTTQSPESLQAKMTAMGLSIKQETIFTTHVVAAKYLRKLGNPACYLLVSDDARPAYEGIPESDTRPEYIVIGDIGDRWNYELLNRVFNMVMDGASILALHRGRYWKTETGLQMDIGAFVTGLEYTTGKESIVIGKPAAAFFDMAVADLGLSKSEVLMIGDDIETDVGGAQRAGIRGLLVKTGKYREVAVTRSDVNPDAVLDSVAELRQLL